MKYYFGDNRQYGADDIKAALGVLVASGGVSIDLNDGEEYNPQKLNSIVGSAVISGVVPESNSSLKLQEEDGEYYVYPGTAVFSDGGIAVVEEKQKQNINPGEYLYLAYSITADDVYFEVSEKELEDNGERLLVAIAYMEKDSTVKNMRTYVKGKIPALSNASWNNVRKVKLSADVSQVKKSGGYVEVTHEFEGEMNFMFVDKCGGIVSSMHIGDKVSYSTDYHITSKVYGYSDKYLGVGSTSYDIVEATLTEHGDGYIKMRYHIPSDYGKNTLTYNAYIGVEV